MQILTGSDLTLALSRTIQFDAEKLQAKPIVLEDVTGELVAKFVADGVSDQDLPTLRLADLFAYLARGYDVIGTRHRVKAIRPPRKNTPVFVDHRAFDRDDSFWSDPLCGRACLRFWKEQRSPAARHMTGA